MYSEVKLVSVTKPLITDEDGQTVISAEEFIGYAARVSNPQNQNNHKSAPKLLKYCMEHQHWSIFETAHLTMEIVTTRDIGRQILRHRSFSFQEFCVAEGTKISCANRGKFFKIPIEKLYERYTSSYWKRSDNLVKVWDAKTRRFKIRPIKEVFNTGVKDVYKVMLENNKHITCTKDHKLLTQNGFKRVGDLDLENDYVGTNGVAVHQTREWLENTKKICMENGSGVKGMAEIGGVSYHTIRKWLKRNNLKFSKQEIISYTSAWNKGLPKERQPNFGKYHNEITRQKMRDSSRKKEDSPWFKGGKTPWRKQVAIFCKGYHNELLIKQNYTCPHTMKPITRENSEVDHIKPVYSHPWLAFDPTNLQVISKGGHYVKSYVERMAARYTVRYSKIRRIEYVGQCQTYDMEIDHEDHNYIADGIVTHNSQRYANPNELGMTTRECRLQDIKNRQNSLETDDKELAAEWEKDQKKVMVLTKKLYKKYQDRGMAKEQLRCILPEGLTLSRMYMSGSVRSWIHYCQLRMGPETQSEHRDVATKAWEHVVAQFPSFRTMKF